MPIYSFAHCFQLFKMIYNIVVHSRIAANLRAVQPDSSIRLTDHNRPNIRVRPASSESMLDQPLWVTAMQPKTMES